MLVGATGFGRVGSAGDKGLSVFWLLSPRFGSVVGTAKLLRRYNRRQWRGCTS